MRLEETERTEEGDETLVLYCPHAEEQYRIPVVEPSAQRIQEIQERLSLLLFAQADELTPANKPGG